MRSRDLGLNVANLGAVASIALLMGGCSFLGLRPSDKLGADDETHSLPTAEVSTNSLLPVPAEVASDIAKIVSGGVVEPVPADRAPSAVVPNMEGGAPDDGNREPPSKWAGGKTVKYRVRDGDTLMKISFAQYGDVYRWREIYNANKAVIKNFNQPPVGAVLEIHGVHYLVIERNGEPYLIRVGDTLGKISGKIYGVEDQWRKLWKNNRQLIHDPNRIYAGFTLYYQKMGPAPAGQPVVNRPPASTTEITVPVTGTPTSEPGAVGPVQGQSVQ